MGIYNQHKKHTIFMKQFQYNKGVHKANHSSTKKLYNPFPTFNYTGKLRPVYPLSPRRQVPDSIPKPDYYSTGIPKSNL
ncbi:unnamed protein product [Cunninghamella echinulata]